MKKRDMLSEEQQLKVKEKFKKEYGEKEGETIFFKSRSAGKFDEVGSQYYIPPSKDPKKDLEDLKAKMPIWFDESGTCHKRDKK
jgi:hypothetical protein